MLANLPLLLLLALALVVHAKHWTCSWGGPGNNPERGGYYLFCTGKIVNETTYDASYECPGDDGIPFEVATFGKLPHEDGIIEFKTPCNTNGFGSVNSCSPATWGLCLGEKSSKTGDYNKCLYMQYYDDCEWPDVIRDNEKPAKVSIYRKTYKIAEEATVTRELIGVSGDEEARNVKDGQAGAAERDHPRAVKASSPWVKDASEPEDKVSAGAKGNKAQ